MAALLVMVANAPRRSNFGTYELPDRDQRGLRGVARALALPVALRLPRTARGLLLYSMASICIGRGGPITRTAGRRWLPQCGATYSREPAPATGCRRAGPSGGDGTRTHDPVLAKHVL